ncbi:nuclease-related domain-containing protein [Cryobacterium sp. TMB1-7]|uniref:nuclease-related domain-containing protein n=1 Tax=Cryobacterium sp. TMB1-7 TaxID=2555866 RepID=UPI00106984FD|nr:nuclease-related domain-containing protein [Cryobacterium sp. TMB1-7]TFC60813.1 NERD domain-containing protein [Cryobacterium sp. TMB1-7]
MSNVGTTVRHQVAAQSVIETLLRQQEGVPQRNWLGRLLGDSPLSPDSVAWYRGALGEIAVGRMLATLPSDWAVFHALPIGKKGADIDHLVVGPGGIITINTKNHSGKNVWVGGQTLMVSGHKQPHIRNADFEAKRVTTLLRQRMPELPAALPVVAILDPRQLRIKTKPQQTTVLSARQLILWLQKRPPVLTGLQVAALTAIIQEPGTWPTPPLPPIDNPMARFTELDGAVRAADLRRRLMAGLRWLAGSAVVIAFLTAMTNRT